MEKNEKIWKGEQMKRKKKMIDFSVSIALLIVMASVAIIGISAVMEPLTSYYFNGIDEDSKRMLLQMYVNLKNTRLIIIVLLFISIVIKSFQYLKEKELILDQAGPKPGKLL